jgi:hypothetical protein
VRATLRSTRHRRRGRGSRKAALCPVHPAAVLVATAAAILAVCGVAAAESPESVFHIDRNKNRNQVHYGVRVDERCVPVGPEPAYNYWLRLEKTPPTVTELSYLQQTAYGFQSQQVESDGRVEVRLRSFPNREIVIRVTPVGGKCKAETFMTIDGKSAYLDKVFVFADEGILMPTVRYIELHGRSNDGHAVYEKIVVRE